MHLKVAPKISHHHLKCANIKLICKCQHYQAPQALCDMRKPLGVSGAVTQGHLQGIVRYHFVKHFYLFVASAGRLKLTLKHFVRIRYVVLVMIRCFFSLQFFLHYCAVFLKMFSCFVVCIFVQSPL